MAGRAKMADWSADDLERAAKFMRELDASANARAAFELAKREQDVEIAKSKASEKEAEAARASQLGNLERIRAEETRKTMETKRESEKVRRGKEGGWGIWSFSGGQRAVLRRASERAASIDSKLLQVQPSSGGWESLGE
jgi:hypothetical protein